LITAKCWRVGHITMFYYILCLFHAWRWICRIKGD